MQRRDFVKSAMCLSCLGLVNSGCSDLLNLQDDEFKDFDHTKSRFYYKSVDELPKKIRIEACSLCQLNCPECRTRQLENTAPKNWLGYLKFDDFKNFIDSHSFVNEVELSFKGEVFLNPELNEIIKYAHEKKVKLTANTGVNFNNPKEETLENLVKYQFERITIALDGATAETYKIYRVGGDFDTVINNIKKINEYKKKYNSEYPKLTWQFIPFGHNEHEIELAKKKAKELNMEIRFRRNWTLDYSPIKNKELVEKQTAIKIVSNKEEHNKDTFENRRLYGCYTLFYTPQFDYNGDLIGCCHVTHNKFGANLFKDGLLNSLNSKTFIKVKENLANAQPLSVKSAPCSTCSRYKIIEKGSYKLNLS